MNVTSTWLLLKGTPLGFGPLQPDLSHPNFLVRGRCYINLLDVCGAEIGFCRIPQQTRAPILALMSLWDFHRCETLQLLSISLSLPTTSLTFN